MVAQGRDAPMRKMQGGQEMNPIISRDRNDDGRYVSAGIVEDDYSADWLPCHGPRQPRFNQRPGSQHGPVIVYRAGEEPEK